MDTSNKKLKKAFTYYQTGRLKDALDICEKILQKESCDEDALELEGKILKDLGRLEEAIITWKINAEYNDNEDAKNSLASIDENKKQHTLSYENLSQLINEATAESNDDIQISVNNTPVSIKTETKISDTSNEDYYPHEEISIFQENASNDTYINDTFEESATTEEKTSEVMHHIVEEKGSPYSNDHLNKDDNSVKEHLSKTPNSIEEFASNKVVTNSMNHSKKSSKKIAYICIGVCIIIIIIIAIVYASTKSNTKVKVQQPKPKTEQVVTKDTKVPAKPEKVVEDKTKTPNVVQPKKLTTEQGQALITNLTNLANEDAIDSVNKLLQENPISVIPEQFVKDYNNAIGFMETKGINYYYEKELNSYNNNNYEDVIATYNLAKPYYQKFEAAPSMLFWAATSYEKLGETENAMDEYKEYLKDFPNSKYYTQECLYNLATYYSKTNDLTQAKQYANELVSKYPDSMYNNTIIKGILDKK